MSDRSEEIHTAVVAALKSDSAVGALIGDRIYDAVQSDVTLPYAQITAEIGEPYDGVDLDGWELLLRVDIWDRAMGRTSGIVPIAKAINAVLHGQLLNLTAGQFINGRMLPGGQIMRRDDDAGTVHVLQRYRFVTQD